MQTVVATRQIRRRFGAAALQYDSIASLQHDVRHDLLAGLTVRMTRSARVLDLGCGTGRGARQLLAARPDLNIVNLDFAWPMARCAAEYAPAVNARAETLPFVDACFDAVTSSLMLQWCEDLPRVLAECRRVLTPGGRLSLTTLGPRSLWELRAAWSQVDSWQHVHDFLPMTALAAKLEEAGFRGLSLRRETRVRHYAALSAVLRSTRGIGAANASARRRPGLTGRDAMRKLEDAYEGYRDANGQLPVSYEVIFAGGLAP